MIINYNSKLIKIKIVYFGPAMSGKTTSLKYLLNHYNAISNLKSIETTTGRTLVFDLGTLFIKGNDWNLQFNLMSATGQDFYASTRPATIEMVDGFIFVVDSQKSLLEDNIRSWNELFIYFGDKIYSIPIIIALNKRDLPDIVDQDIIIQSFKLDNFKNYKIIETIAESGNGVIESFNELLKLIMNHEMIYA
ncbi:MAG: GTP-binding protein [Promethearchaeota archaeon]